MTYATNNLYGSTVTTTAQPRVEPESLQPKTFAAVSGGPTLAVCTPVAYDITVDKWKVWSGVARVVETASIAVDATGGTFTITIEGLATAAVAFNATAAAVKTAILLNRPGVEPDDFEVTGGPGAAGGATPYVITWSGAKYANQDAPIVTTGAGSLTGGAGTAAVTTVAQVDGNGVDVIRGFVWPDPIVLDATNDVQGVVMLEGTIHYDDIVLPSGESAATLKTYLRSETVSGPGVRQLGLKIEGLSQVR